MNWFELSVKSRANESVPVSLPTIYSPCTNISDRRCSCKLCTKGYYRNKTISKCLSYSGCCLDEMDEVVSQCVDQRLPRTQTCSYHNRNPCGSKCWYDEITVLKPDGKHSCQPCPVCSNDMGLTVPCGGFVREEMIVGCQRPVNWEKHLLISKEHCSIVVPVLLDMKWLPIVPTNQIPSVVDVSKDFITITIQGGCQECFWCCSHGRQCKNYEMTSEEGMLFAENREICFYSRQYAFIFTYYKNSLVKTTKIISIKSLLKLDNLTLTTGSVDLALHHAFRRRKNSKTKVQKPDILGLEKLEDKTALQRQHCMATLACY